MADLTPVVIALVGTIFGGAGLKATEYWLTSASRKNEGEFKLRDELRLQIADLKEELARQRTEIDKTEAEMDSWRDKYWQLREQYAELQTELLSALQQIKENAEASHARASKPPES